MKKTLIAVICLLVVAMSLCVVASAEADLTNDSMETATELSFGTSYSGTISEESRDDFYKFTLTKSGSVNIKVTTAMGYTWYKLRNAQGEELWGNNYSKGIEQTLHLTAGDYYFSVSRNSDYGNYTLTVNYKAVEESFAEGLDGANNNSFEAANLLTFGTEYQGQLAVNDTADFYKFVMPESGRVKLKVTTTMGYTWYTLYDSVETEIWGDDYNKGVEGELYLKAGTYYCVVSKRNDYGNYSFSVSYDESGESFKENEATNNNSFENASDITFGTDYKGQLALNDTADYYKFVLTESGKINIKVTTTMGYTWYTLYNEVESEVWGDDYTNGVDGMTYLTAGTYYFVISKKNDYGNYSFKATFESADESFKESQSTMNNSFENASSVMMGTDYKGLLARNDTVDYYKFTLAKSGKVNLKFITTMGYTWYELYNELEVKLWGDDYKNGIDGDVHLTAGTYYFIISRRDDYGNYSFKMSFEESGESFNESDGANNNDYASASKITLGTEYKGQLALNDKIDYYEFTITSPQKITISSTASPEARTSYGLYAANGTHLWGGGWKGNIVEDTEMLEAGTYYFAVGYDSIYGDYGFKLLEQHTCNSDIEKVTPATCTENGRIDKLCSICNRISISEDIPAQHAFGAWVVDTPAVCNESNGSQTRTCTVCGATETEEILATDHQMNDQGVCSICGAKYTPTNGGCSMVIAGPATAAMAISLLGAAVTVLKKKRED